MKKSAPFLIVMALILIALPAFAQFAEPLSTEWSRYTDKVRSMDGATTLFIAILIVQGLYLILRTALGDMLGHHKFVVIALLSVLSIMGEKYTRGEPLINVFTDASTIMAYQVLAHQSMKHYREARYGKDRSNDSGNAPDSDELLIEDVEDRPLPFREQG